ncbi:hypothetical protein A5647_07810 [Mycobacterium sp. 1100029.7]|nr:hypothetical protein A5647_07810 [Mycobacterium sp. 1100029.7]
MTGKHRANAEKAEEDIEPDPNVAGSRANRDDNDGSYVGRASADDDFGSGETGAEARSQDG